MPLPGLRARTAQKQTDRHSVLAVRSVPATCSIIWAGGTEQTPNRSTARSVQVGAQNKLWCSVLFQCAKVPQTEQKQVEAPQALEAIRQLRLLDMIVSA